MSQFDDPNREAVGLDPIWTEGPIPDAGDDEPGAEPAQLKPKAKAEPKPKAERGGGDDDEAG